MDGNAGPHPLEELLRHIRGFDDVWIATGAEIAGWHAANAVAPEQHPINVYAAYVAGAAGEMIWHGTCRPYARRASRVFPETIHKAKLHILDTLGAAIAGSASSETHAVLEMLGIPARQGRAPIWGWPITTDARTAAFVNGVSAHAFELDDSGGCDHSGAVVLPAALAVLGDESTVQGRELLRSVLIGYEVGRRVLEAAGGYEVHNDLGWHSTGTCGALRCRGCRQHAAGFDARK